MNDQRLLKIYVIQGNEKAMNRFIIEPNGLENRGYSYNSEIERNRKK